MLTGLRAFVAPTPSHVISRILSADVDWSRLPKATPPQVVALLRRCLTANPQDRLQDISAARIELEEVRRQKAHEPVIHANWIPFLVGAFCIVAFLGVVMWPRKTPTAPAPPAPAATATRASTLIADSRGGRIRMVSGGVIRTVVGGSPQAEPLRSPYSWIYQVGRGVAAPEVLSQVLPSYTEAARTANAKGRVILESIVRRDGSVEITRVVQGAGYGLDESAAMALREWKFRPGTIGPGGPSVDVTMNIIVTFEPR
jgi:TonB family protein